MVDPITQDEIAIKQRQHVLNIKRKIPQTLNHSLVVYVSEQQKYIFYFYKN